MDYGALPPEINSARMYSGPGSEPLLTAAAAWNSLAAELRSTAASYQSVISGLTSEGWLGPASAAMAAAATPYAAWMNTTAAQAEQTAVQAQAAAGAYETAFAMTVPPPVIAANRSLLMSLIATNVLGQNAPAIAATETHYGEMWAQDAAAMYGYAGNSAAASQVTPFTSPQQTTNPAGQAGQAAAVAQATGTSAGTGVQSTLSQVMSTVPTALQGLASPASSASGLGGILGPSSSSSGGLGGILNPLNQNSFLNSTFLNGVISGGYTNPALISPAVTSALADISFLGVAGSGGFGSSGFGFNPAILMSAGAPAALPGLGGSAVSAGMGRATLVGALSVPQSWASAAPVTNPAATAFPASGWTAAPDVGAGEMPGMPGMPGMPMVGSAGRGFGFAAPRYGFRPTVMAHPPAAG